MVHQERTGEVDVLLHKTSFHLQLVQPRLSERSFHHWTESLLECPCVFQLATSLLLTWLLVLRRVLATMRSRTPSRRLPTESTRVSNLAVITFDILIFCRNPCLHRGWCCLKWHEEESSFIDCWHQGRYLSEPEFRQDCELVWQRMGIQSSGVRPDCLHCQCWEVESWLMIWILS